MDLTGRTLSHYRLGAEISRGGMGVVYRATDSRLHREVALKVLPDELMNDPDRRRRFLQEAQAASAIEHPNVAVIYDADEADGHTFIAMELIRGQTLSDWLAAAHPSVAKRLDVATQIASGLSRAHEKQIVHRDLKPANVMVTADGDAKIIDFGIAKLMETAPSSAAETRVQQDTGVGVVLGTMTYMSPEQARGDRVDHRSDIFSFGTVLHEMLTGQAPFQGRSGLETAAAILHTPAPRLSPLGPGVVGEVTADLQRVLDKCLAKDPADRYQGMKDVVVDLRAVRRRLESGSQPVTVAAPAVVPGPARSGSRVRWVLVGLGVASLAGFSALGWHFLAPRPVVPSPRGSTKPSVAVLYFDNSTEAPDLAWLRTGITEMVVTDLSQSTDLEVVSSDRLYSALAALKRTDDKVLSPDVVNQVADRTGVDHVVVGSYMKSGDAIRINVRLQDVKTGRILTSESVEGPSTSSLFQMVDDLSHRLLTKFEGLAPNNEAAKPLIGGPGEGSDRGLGQVTTSSIDAYRAYSEGINQHERFREADAATLFEKALAIDPSFAMAQAKLAVAEENLGRLDLRDRYAQLALDHADRLTPRERYYIEGFYYSHTPATVPRAIDAYRKCVEIDPGDQSCRHNLAVQLSNLELYDQSAAQSEELIRRGSANGSTYFNLAETYIALDQIDRAVTLIDGFMKVNPDSAPGLRAVGLTMIAAGRYGDARQALDRAQTLSAMDFTIPTLLVEDEILQEDWPAARATTTMMVASPDLASHWFGNLFRGVIEAYAGHCAEATAAADRATAAIPSGLFTASSRSFAADMLAACGEPQAALRALRPALAEAKGSPAELDALGALAWTAEAAGQPHQADDTLGHLTALGTSIAQVPTTRLLNLVRGRVALARHDFAEAISDLRAAQAALPRRGQITAPTPHVEIWFALGQAYLGAGRPKDAEPWFRKVADSTFEHVADPVAFVRSFFYLGQIHEQLGDQPAAREAYRRFVAYWKDGSIARGEIAEATRKVAGRPRP